MSNFVCVCITHLFLTRYMQPEGPWQRPAAALAGSSVFLAPPLHELNLSPTTQSYTRETLSPKP